jgi:hypothetical protein
MKYGTRLLYYGGGGTVEGALNELVASLPSFCGPSRILFGQNVWPHIEDDHEKENVA